MFLSRYACIAGVFTLSGLLVAGITVLRLMSFTEFVRSYWGIPDGFSCSQFRLKACPCPVVCDVWHSKPSYRPFLLFRWTRRRTDIPPMILPSLHLEFVKQRLCLHSAKLSYCKCLQKVRAFVRERPGWKLDEKNVVAELPCRNLLCSDLNVLQKRARLPDSSLWCFSGSVCSGVCPFRNCWHVEISTWWAVLPRMELTVHLLLSAPSLLRT